MPDEPTPGKPSRMAFGQSGVVPGTPKVGITLNGVFYPVLDPEYWIDDDETDPPPPDVPDGESGPAA